MSLAPPRLDVVYFKLFDDCNAKCVMCECWERPRSRRDVGHYSDALASVLAARPGSIRFTGGEPLLHRGLPDLVRMAAEAGVRVSVISNGRLLRGRLSRLAESGCDEIILSLDGIGGTHDSIRGTPGLFKRVMAGIDGINRTSMSYGINTVVQRQGIRELPSMARLLLEQVKAPQWWQLIPVRDHPGLRPSAEDVTWLQAVLPDITEAMARRQVALLADAGMFDPADVEACDVPQFTAYIDAESGLVYSCNMLAYSDPPIGRVFHAAMNEAWLGDAAARVRQECESASHAACSRCDAASRMMNRYLRRRVTAGAGGVVKVMEPSRAREG
jgi:MoaA/NifB/PqqE/SkfB family radical SAM enzyme